MRTATGFLLDLEHDGIGVLHDADRLGCSAVSLIQSDNKCNLSSVCGLSVLRYDPWKSYGQSKLCNILHTRELNRRLQVGQLLNLQAGRAKAHCQGVSLKCDAPAAHSTFVHVFHHLMSDVCLKLETTITMGHLRTRGTAAACVLDAAPYDSSPVFT